MGDLAGYRRERPGTQPALLHPAYGSTVKRAPAAPLVRIPHTISEITGPLIKAPPNTDLTKQHKGEPMGERIIVSGRVLDEDGRPVAGAIVEIWQANAAGRYFHALDQRDAPLDPNFVGNGRCRTDAEGRYGFFTIKPGAYPVPDSGRWWRPPHIHFSILGPGSLSRLVTQMYFPGDPLNAFDRLILAIPDPEAQARLVASAVHPAQIDGEWLGFAHDMVLRGRHATPPL